MAATLSASYGLEPYPWQEFILNDWLARKGDRWAHLTCGLAVPRQNGKNGALEIRELFGMIGRHEHILHSAHLVKTAAKHFRRFKEFFGQKANDPAAKYPELNALVREVRSVNGQEAIYLKRFCIRCNRREGNCECDRSVREYVDGGSIEIISRSKGSGRGYTVDLLVFDEAQHMEDDELEALMPTTSAAPSGDPQWIFTGTPPGPNINGEVWVRLRNDARSGDSKRTSWNEWSEDDLSKVYDRPTWERTNPTLPYKPSMLSVIEGEASRFSLEGFARERCGRWPETAGVSVLNPLMWNKLVNPYPPPPTARPTALGLDMSPDRVLSIAACWQLEDGTHHVEAVAVEHSADLVAAAEWLKQRAGKRIPVLVDSKSPAAAIAPTLLQKRVKVHVTSASEYGRACELFTQDVKHRRLLHAGQAQLDNCIDAGKRPIGEAGLWGWDRRDPEQNIAPLVAATLARFGVTKAKMAASNGRRSNGREAGLLSA